MKNVLIVDDVEILRRRIKSVIKEYKDLKVFEASNYSEAISILDNNDIDLAFLDIDLSASRGIKNLSSENINKTGIDIVKYISENKPKIKRCIVSGTIKKIGLLEAYGHGTEYFVAKPYDNELIKDVINKTLNIQKEGF